MSDIRVAADAQTVALAGMLADLIRQNLEQNPKKRNDFEKLATSVFINVIDAEVSITLAFSAGALVVHDGSHGAPDISIVTTSDLLLAMCMLRVVNGIPRPFHRDSRALIGNMLRGAVRITGMARNPLQMMRFARLMSVNG